jgi:hypothetical protein
MRRSDGRGGSCRIRDGENLHCLPQKVIRELCHGLLKGSVKKMKRKVGKVGKGLSEEKNRNWKAAKGNFALFKTSRKQFDEMEFVPGAKCRPHERLKQ